jgi:hypothetical protein
LLTIFPISLLTFTGLKRGAKSAISISESRRRGIETALKQKKGIKAAESQTKRFKEWCLKNSLPPQFSYETLTGYICHHVHKNAGSTKSVSNVLASLKGHCLRSAGEWIGASESFRLAEFVRMMKFRDFTASSQKRPLQLHHLISFVRKWDLNVPALLELATLLFTGHHGLLRSAELLSKRRVKDIFWSPDRSEFAIMLDRTKTLRSGQGVFVSFRDHPGLSAVKLLRAWFDQQGLWENDDLHVFPPRRGSGFDFSKTLSVDSFRKMIKKVVKENGLDPKRYSGHSLRAGGATDLFVGRVPLYIIKKMGRWASDAVLIYFRDDEDVCDAVTSCFGKAAMAAEVGGR